MEILPLDIKANLSKAEQLLKQAAKGQKLDLVVFPEDFITGPIPYNLEYALDENSEAISFLRNLARQYNTYIVPGSFINHKGGKYYNTAVLIDNKGKIILEYDKNNLWLPERTYLTPGTALPVVKTSIGTIGLAVCWDLAYPEVFQALAGQGADIICLPSYWTREDGGPLTRKYPNIQSEVNMVDALCPARAIETNALVIYANGAKKGEVYLKTKKIALNQIGHSQICAPLEGVVKKMPNNDEGFISYTYDKKIGRDAESRYLLRRDIFPRALSG